MRTLFTTLFTLLVSYTITSQELIRYPQLRSQALSGATVASAGNDNPAGLPLLKQMRLDLSYMNHYAIADLAQLGTSFSMPIKELSLGAQLSYFGFGLYNETRFGVTAAHRLFKTLTLGLRINYLRVSMINEEESQSLFSSDIGILFTPTRWIQIGLSGNHFLRTARAMELYRLSLPYSYRGGVEVIPDETFHLLGEIEWMESEGVIARVGLEYLPLPQWPIRVGIKSKGWTPSFGTGYQFNHFSVDVAALYDVRLGLSFGIGVHADF